MSWLTRGDGTRSRILEFVETNPGAAKSEICEGLGLGWGTVVYHVDLLERRGVVRTAEDRGRVRVFGAAVPREHQAWYAVMRDRFSQDIVARMAGGRSVRAFELAGELGASRRLIARHLSRLQGVGLLERGGEDGAYRVSRHARRFFGVRLVRR